MGNTPSASMSPDNMNDIADLRADNPQIQEDEIPPPERDTSNNSVEEPPPANPTVDSNSRSSFRRRYPPFLGLSLFSARPPAARGEQNPPQQSESHGSSDHSCDRSARHAVQNPLRTLEMVSVHRRQISHLFGTMARQRILSAARSSQRQPLNSQTPADSTTGKPLQWYAALFPELIGIVSFVAFWADAMLLVHVPFFLLSNERISG